jgi:hypothetical protein
LYFAKLLLPNDLPYTAILPATYLPLCTVSYIHALFSVLSYVFLGHGCTPLAKVPKSTQPTTTGGQKTWLLHLLCVNLARANNKIGDLNVIEPNSNSERAAVVNAAIRLCELDGSP